MVSPAIVTATPPLTWKARRAWSPLTVSRAAPGPSMSRLLVMGSSPLVSVMVLSRIDGAKMIVSPLRAAVIAARRDPRRCRWCSGRRGC